MSGEETVVYGDVTETKRLCGILPAEEEETPSQQTLDVTAFLGTAATVIDDSLKNFEDTLPLSSVPAKIGVIANYYAAGNYLQRNNPGEVMHPFLVYAERELAKYIQETYTVTDQSSPFYIGTDTS